MNKLHNALKTLNLTLEQRNELVKVLSELGGGGECLEIGINVVSNEHKVYVTINDHVFPIYAGNFDANVTAEFNKFDITTALNINTLDDIAIIDQYLIKMS